MATRLGWTEGGTCGTDDGLAAILPADDYDVIEKFERRPRFGGRSVPRGDSPKPRGVLLAFWRGLTTDPDKPRCAEACIPSSRQAASDVVIALDPPSARARRVLTWAARCRP